jgi:hypothetical protein
MKPNPKEKKDKYWFITANGFGDDDIIYPGIFYEEKPMKSKQTEEQVLCINKNCSAHAIKHTHPLLDTEPLHITNPKARSLRFKDTEAWEKDIDDNLNLDAPEIWSTWSQNELKQFIRELLKSQESSTLQEVREKVEKLVHFKMAC